MHGLATDQKKLDDGTLLHKALLQATADVHGVDIDEAGIETLLSRLGGGYTAGDLCTEATRAELTSSIPIIGRSTHRAPSPVSCWITTSRSRRGTSTPSAREAGCYEQRSTACAARLAAYDPPAATA
jgi:hypothetical protein